MMNWKRKARLASNANASDATPVRVKKAVKAKAPKAPAKLVPAPTGVSPIVEVDPAEAKSGCMYCPLFPFTKRFAEGAFDYKRDAVKIQTKEIDGHTIKSHNIREAWTEVDMLIVGEAPGGQEDAKGKAFIGRSGKLLREALGMLVDLPIERIGITNILHCRPPRNRDPRKTEIKCCGYELIREIEARKPKLVVTMGNFSMEFLTGQRGITTFATRILKCIRPEFPDLTVLASLHPAYILRFDHEMEKFCKALEKADLFLKGEYVPPMGAGEYYTLDTIEDVKAVLDGFVADGLPVAFDTECGSLSPFQTEFPALLCYSLSNKEGEGCTIPYDHADAPWDEEEKVQVADMMREFFLSGVPLIAQNEKFDRQHIRKSIDIDMPVPLRDTMTTHMVLDERRGTHGLKTLAFAYTGMGGYEKPLDDYVAKHKEANPDKGGSYANIPGEILFPYAAMDADVTIRCDRAMIKSSEYRKNIRFRRLAENFLPAVGTTLADLEYAGAAIDPKVVAFLDEKYMAEMVKHQKQIAALPKVRQFVTDTLKAGKKLTNDKFNPGSRQQLAKVLFDYYGLVPKELTDKGFEILIARHKSVNAKRKGKGAVGFDNVVRAAIRRKEWDFFSTKADVLHDYERVGNDLCPLILNYRSASTLHGTFVKPLSDFLDPLNRIHGTYWVGGTVTGRLSSSDPNLQNIPNKGGGLIKQAYVSRFGDEGLLLQLDFSQIELRIAACWYNDAAMIEAYKKGIDLHALTAADMHHMSIEDFMALPEKERKPKRTRCKRINFGVLYGGGPPALQSTLKKDGVFVTVEECKEFIVEFFKVRPGLRKGIDKTEKGVLKRGYLESFTGRRRRVPEVRSEDEQIVARALRQSINFPIQNGASEMTLMAMVLINRELKKYGFKSEMVLTVHDSLVFDCHVDEVIEVACMGKMIMENLPKLSEEILPGLKWDWLTVPIVADAEAGVTWGQMVGFDPLTVQEGGQTKKALWKEEDGKKLPARGPVNIDELWDLVAWKAA